MKFSNIRLQKAGSARHLGRGVVVCGAVGVVAVALASGVAVAANSGTDGAPAKAAAAAKGGVLGKLGGRLEHAEATMRTKQGDRTVLVQRGVISALDGTALSVRSTDGWTGSWTLTDTTRIRQQKAKATASDLKVGDTVLVRGEGSGQSGTAKVVRDRGVVATTTH
jgi:hypothetical protein